MAKREARAGPGCNWSPNFHCITVRAIFEVYVICRLKKLVKIGMGSERDGDGDRDF